MESSPNLNDTTNNLNDDDRASSVGSSGLDPIKLNKELRSIMNQSKAIIFTGENSKEYIRWKKALESEVRHLEPSSAQWYELLLRRTSHQAQELVKKYGNVSEEMGIDKAISAIWKAFNKQHPSKEKGSEDVMNDIMLGPLLLSLIHI